ncbi:MAG: type III polyketide synthase [Bacteroidetes bacterium CG12_big_fil_rev_8_21_14_0_65_60_17]|nr:MAG: type III polyketide synthase [Bacteroidetes bacterium CG12_big_fil_rev_8_21_14_0_65_60_17]
MAFIHGLAHVLPEHEYAQEDIRTMLGRGLEPGSREARFMERIYRQSDIDTRYSVIPDYRQHGPDGVFFDGYDGRWQKPTTGQRNAIYARQAPALFERAARGAAQAARRAGSDVELANVTHVITVSCTGFMAPGPDFELVKRLGLPPSTARMHFGFMGCYAAIPALRTAATIVTAHPEAVVLVACVELCTLHLQADNTEIDALVSASVFADGGAAALVAAAPPGHGYHLDSFHSHVAPGSEADMAWTIGDNGFDMVLSTYVPDILEANVPDLLAGAGIEQGAAGATGKDVDIWAVHPGGRAILDKVARGLELDRPSGESRLSGNRDDGWTDPLAASRRVLRSYGNMSSPTILFVLEDLLTGEGAAVGPPDAAVCALAFGPGLTVETAMLRRVGGGT